MKDILMPLVQTTLRDPRAAATRIMSWKFDRQALWTALALVAIVNAFVVLLLVELSGSAMPMPGYTKSPLALFMLIAGLMVLFVHAMYWAGLTVGGSGTLNDILAVLVWFQALRAAAQLGIVVVSLAIPSLGLLMSLVVAIWGFWILLNFIAVALNLSSVGHSLLVLFIAGVGLVLGLGLLLALIGLGGQGV